MPDIDFVLPWVDGSDPIWLKSKREYESKESFSHSPDSNSECRYRDNGLLRYWFRGVERFAPWVNKIHFVNCGQIPEWLDTSHPKLHLVDHRDFIPPQYLPTFNSCTIEMNMHRIEGLTERFVYFNDDIFMLREVSPDFFFKSNLPVLDCELRYPHQIGYNNWSRHLFNNYCIINTTFDIRRSIWDNRRKWFNIQEIGLKRARQNFLCFISNKTIPFLTYGHIAIPHLKTTLQEVWDRYPDIMDTVCRHKFRSDDQTNHLLFCGWNQAKGLFSPALVVALGYKVTIRPEHMNYICNIIRQQGSPQICVNESDVFSPSEKEMGLIAGAFREILPEKSRFELW